MGTHTSNPPIPFLDLASLHKPVQDDIVRDWTEVLRSARFIGGPYVDGFEEAFAQACGVQYCVGVANGTDALVLALRALSVGPGDAVVVPALTFIATAEAVSLVGARPVLVDVEPGSYGIDPTALLRLDDPNIKAVIPVHLYGQPASMAPILAVAQERGWYVVEDCAQAHGATYAGESVGSLGDLGCFSFYPGKNLGAAGDAGAVIGKDRALLAQVRRLSDHGRVTRNEHGFIGCNSRLDALQAVMLRHKLPHLPSWNRGRRQVASWYRELLGNSVVWQRELSDREHVYHVMVARVPNRDSLIARLRDHQIPSAVHYPRPIHRQPAYAHLGYGEGSFVVSEAICAECLSLPMDPSLTREQVARVCEVVRAHLQIYAGEVA